MKLKLLLVPILISILGAGAYYGGSSYGAFINSQIGGMVGDIVDNVTTCPTGDEQLIVEYTNEDQTILYKHSDFIGEQGLISFNAVSSMTSVCAGSPGAGTENCDPNDTTGQNDNTFRFNGDTEVFTDFSTSDSLDVGAECSNWLGPGATNPETASCVIAGSIRGTDAYQDGIFYVADIMRGTFGPRAVSICGVPVGKTVDSDDCTQMSAEPNITNSSLAIDPTTNSVFMNMGGFEQWITRFDVDSVTGAIDSLILDGFDAQTQVVPYDQISDTNAQEIMDVIPGGRVYLIRRENLPTDISRVVSFNQNLIGGEQDDFPIEVGNAGIARALKWSVPESAFYACGAGSTPGTNIVRKFDNVGTILATLDAVDIDPCGDIAINQVTNRVFVSVNASGVRATVHELDPDTLAIIRSVEVDTTTTSFGVAQDISMDATNEKIYSVSKLGILSNGHIVRLSTCSSI